MAKIQKTNVPIFFDEDQNPIALILFVGRQRVIYTIKPAGEEELISLYQPNEPIKNHVATKKDNNKKEDNHTESPAN